MHMATPTRLFDDDFAKGYMHRATCTGMWRVFDDDFVKGCGGTILLRDAPTCHLTSPPVIVFDPTTPPVKKSPTT